METNIRWIDSDQQLASLCKDLQQNKLLAADTEFIRTDTFYPNLALIQLSDGADVWLLDVLAINEFEPLRKLFSDPERTFIFHACLEDLEVLEHALSLVPENLFDTQLAAGLANVGYSMGYARLVQAMLDIDVGKNETRSDWMRRPLSKSQIHYAAEDVIHLHELYTALGEKLAQANRLDWLEEETQALRDMVASRSEIADYYLRIKGAWRLEPRSMAVLRRLAEWREQEARDLNRPRGRVVQDAVLLELASRMPTSMSDLNKTGALSPGASKRWGHQIVALVEQAQSDSPPEPLPIPLSRSETSILKSLRQQLYDIAEEQGIPSEFLCNKKELEHIIRSALDGRTQWPERFQQGWRCDLTTELRTGFEPLDKQAEAS